MLPTKSKQLKLRSLSDQSFDCASALIFGPSGVGKTSLVRSMAPHLRKLPDGTPDWSRVLYVIADPGQASIRDLGNIQTCTLWEDMKPHELASALYDPANARQFDLIFIDGLDAVAQKVHAMLDEYEQQKPKPDTFAVWGGFAKEIRRWILAMRDVPATNVVFVSHDSEREDSTFKCRPAWPGGATRDELLGFFDYVFYMRMAPATDAAVKGKEWPAVFITSQSTAKGGDPRYEVKCRMRADRPQLPGKIHADLGAVWATLFSPVKESA